MKTAFLSLLVFCMALCDANAQTTDFNHYQPLISAGTIPSDFTTLSSVKFQSDQQKIDENSKKRVQKTQTQFYLESNFALDELLRSGRVVFGDEVTAYLNNIKDVLLKDMPDVRDKIRIYTLRSNDANAFTSDNGIVLVTTGLIAQSENEAEIAFVLCHEFNHYIKQHALTGYVSEKEIGQGHGIYHNLDPYDLKLAQFSYAKELESEADSLGLELYWKSPYSLQAVDKVFDVMLYSYLPFDEEPFPKDYFNSGSYQLPDDLFLKDVKAIDPDEASNDEESTHPNILKRRTAINNAIGIKVEDNKSLFIQPQQQFNEVQKVCRYEDMMLALSDVFIEEAFYDAFLLQKRGPGNPFITKVMARSLYEFSMYRAHETEPANETWYKNVEGESQQIYHLLQTMPKSELAILALRYNWQTYKASGNDATLKEICKQLAGSLVNDHSLTLHDFKSSNMSAPDSVPVKKDSSDNKYAKIKSGSTVNSENAYWRYAFVDFMNDEEFQALFSSAVVKKDGENEPKGKKKKTASNTDLKEPIKDLVVVNPLFFEADLTSRDPVRYLASEKEKVAMKDKFDQCADLLNVKVNYLESFSLKENETEKFNDLMVLNDWLSEQLTHDETTLINSNNERLQALVKKYNTEHFAWIGVASLKEPKHYIGAKIFLTLFFFPRIPFTIMDVARPNYTSVVFALVANGDQGDFEDEYYNASGIRATESEQKSNFYSFLQTLVTKNK